MGPTELAKAYWTRPTIAEAMGVIAAHLKWGYAARAEFPYLLTPVVREALGDISDKTALEIGCGIGRILLPMATEFRQVVGVDLCAQMLTLADEYLVAYPERSQIDLLQSDGKSISWNEQVDFVYSMIVFQHLPDMTTVRSYLREAVRILKPGGVARIQTYRGPEPKHWDPHWGCYFPSLDAFADEFTAVGLKILEKQEDVLWAAEARREPVEQDWLWISAQKPHA